MKNIEKESIILIKKRYQKMEGKFPYTIKKLNKSGIFKDLFFKLKSKDYPDWVIYMALSNSIINYRINTRPKNTSDLREIQKEFMDLMNRMEKEDDAEVPMNEFTEEKIEFAIEANILSFLKGEGYQFRRATPNLKALRHLAKEKFGYFNYDIPHEKWFEFEK